MTGGRLPGFLSGLTDRLAVRILLLLSLALLPLGMIAVHTTAEVLRTARESTERVLIGLTADAIAGKRALIESAMASAYALGPLVAERLGDIEACRALLTDYVNRSGVFTFAGFIGADGMMRCASRGGEIDYSLDPLFLDLLAQPRALVLSAGADAVTREAVVTVTQPIYSAATLAGFLTVAISQTSVQMMARISLEEAPRRVVLFNHAGELLSEDPQTAALHRAELPRDVELVELVGEGSQVFRGATHEAGRATFVVVELIRGRLYALGIWPEAAAGPTGWRAIVVPMLFPVLMWMASLGVLYFAIYHLVIRHVRSLNRQMRRFALGHRGTETELPDSAPHELRELGGTFRKMTWIIARDEAAREADLAEKTVLLKEIHHRVKNNLQLIASILNLQMRQLQDPGAQAVLRNVQDRVLGLATIHRSLYEKTQLSKLQVDRVLDDILRQYLSVGVVPESGIDITTRLDPLRIDPDRLVPLTLLLAEAVTNALKHIGGPGNGGAPWLDISLRERDGKAELTIANSIHPSPADCARHAPNDTRLGSELIAAFALQLDAELERGPVADPRGPAYALTIRFALEDSGPPLPAPDVAEKPAPAREAAALPAEPAPEPACPAAGRGEPFDNDRVEMPRAVAPARHADERG